MNLVSDSAYWIAGVLALAALAGAGWLTSRTPRTWKGALLNGVTVLVAGALLVTSMGLVLNRQNGWYATTDDLFASATHGGSTAEAYGAESPFGEGEGTQGGAPAGGPVALPPLPEPGARVQRFEVPTSTGQQVWHMTVILPADYFAPGAEDRRYPVLYAGHGFPGNPQQYETAFNIQKMADASIHDKRIRPFIIAIPDITPTGTDTECIFGPDGPAQLETWLMHDIPAFLSEHLRVVNERTSRAWLGFSLGGWCGTMLTMRHPEVFGAAASLGGYYQPWWVGPAPWPAGDPRDTDYDLVGLAAKKPPPVALWIQTSKKDPQSWPRTEQFLKAVKPPTAVTAVIDASGGHTFAGWVGHGPAVLAWIGRTVPGFAP